MPRSWPVVNQSKFYTEQLAANPSKLFNAHRPVQLRLFPPRSLIKNVPRSERWRYLVTPDVSRFADETDLRGRKLARLVKDPAQYFSTPENVDLPQRRQIYLPEFVLTLIRTPHLPPRYASFWVPLWFSKLDMKDYLDRVYGVGVVHIRSYVEQQKVFRESVPSRSENPMRPGRLMRPMSKKKMTVELKEPFVWPEEVDDYAPWEKETFHAARKERNERQGAGKDQTQAQQKPRETVAEQARALIRAKEVWRPTWQTVPWENKVLEKRVGPGTRPST